MDADTVERRTRSRLDRQAILDGAHPPQIVAMFDEGALHRPVGGPAVMAEQCRRLVELAQRPHIHIQVIPTSAGAHAGLAGGFILASGSYGHVAHLDDPLRAHVVSAADDIDTLFAKWEAVRAVALPTSQSSDMILRMVETWEHQT